jgi:hypothetical protein
MAAAVRTAERHERSWVQLGRLLLLVGTISIIWTMWALTPPSDRVAFFAGRYTTLPMRLYMVGSVGYLGLVIAVVWHNARRYRQHSERPSVRVGLLIVELACLLGAAYIVLKTAGALPPLHGVSLPRRVEALGQVAACLGGILIGIGVCWPALVDRAERARRWMTSRRRMLRLDPLWRALCAAVPDVALDPPRHLLVERLDPRDVSYRLIRRVIEIRDAQLELRPYTDGPAEELAHLHPSTPGRPGVDGEARAHAASLRAALVNHAGQLRPATPDTPSLSRVANHGGDDIAAETTWLIRLSDAFVALDSRPRQVSPR